MLRRHTLPSYPVYLLLQGGSTGLFFMVSTVVAVYGVRDAHLNALQLVLVGTTVEAVSLVFQVPTGAIADAYSRRFSVLLGLALSGLGFILWGAIPRFETILLAQLLWGLGYTFYDGAQQAWIADELGDERAGQAFIRGAQASQIGALGGIVVSVAIASWHLSWPIIVGGALHLPLLLLLLLVMPERAREHGPVHLRSAGAQLAGTVRAGVQASRQRPVLLTILAIAAIFGAASEGVDRLRDIHFLQDTMLPHLWGLSSIVWFGAIQAGGLGLSVFASEVAKRRLDTTSHRHVAATLAAINALLVVAVVAFGLMTSFVPALLLIWMIFVLRRTNTPLMTAWLNQSLEPSIRATMFSMQSLSDSLGQVLGGPVLGLLATAVSIRAGIAVSGLLLAPALVLYVRTLRAPAAQGVGSGV